MYFNSQPHEEADSCSGFIKAWNEYFNSQPHEEADCSRFCKNHSDFSISTHSLTKRLTVARAGILYRLGNFNSQPHEEADRDAYDDYMTQKHFNSQPHEEADCSLTYLCIRSYISTHSLTKRLTTVVWSSTDATGISTHSLTKRLTINAVERRKELWNFNSQPHEEADHYRELIERYGAYFNSQPHEEADECS